jgi:hypothetical protein
VRGHLGLLGPQLGVPKPGDAGAGAALPHCARYCADRDRVGMKLFLAKIITSLNLGVFLKNLMFFSN